MSPADAAIQKKIYGSGHRLNSLKSLEESELLKKGISETNKNETKEQKMELLSMSLRTLATSILENALAGKRVL